MFLRLTILAAFVLAAALGDTLTLRSGKVIEGSYLGGDSRRVRMAVGDNLESFEITEVSKIEFGAPAAAPAPAAARSSAAAAAKQPEPAPARERVSILRPSSSATAAPAAAEAKGVSIPAGTNITVRMIDDIDSQVHQVGQTFRASLDEPVMVDGKTLVPRSGDVTVKLVEDKQSGKLTGRTELTLDLVSIAVNGKMLDVQTQEVTQASQSRTGETAKVVGGATALGAIIGAIAGGGKGAAIGAVTGAGAGTAVQVLTKGERVRIPSETRLSFTLQQPVHL